MLEPTPKNSQSQVPPNCRRPRTSRPQRHLRGNCRPAGRSFMGLGRVELPTSRSSGDRRGVRSPARKRRSAWSAFASGHPSPHFLPSPTAATEPTRQDTQSIRQDAGHTPLSARECPLFLLPARDRWPPLPHRRDKPDRSSRIASRCSTPRTRSRSVHT